MPLEPIGAVVAGVGRQHHFRLPGLAAPFRRRLPFGVGRGLAAPFRRRRLLLVLLRHGALLLVAGHESSQK
ncbi:MAG: hypothetical protein HY983_01430 [Candidatus Magasanikbacteria bacterium]|nr:hypothetical protein [Candidatus Magasanikbacteria bacterium]